MPTQSRRLRRIEVQLIESMLARTTHDDLIAELASAEVIEFEEGQPGCLRFIGSLMYPKTPEVVAERTFVDTDGVPVSISISVDEAGRLLEFDIFKNDFSPVVSLRECLRKPSGPIMKALAGMRS